MTRKNGRDVAIGLACVLGLSSLNLSSAGLPARQSDAYTSRVCSTVLPEVIAKRLKALTSPEGPAAPATDEARRQQQNVGQATELALVAGLMWPNASTLRIRFMNTPEAMQTRIMSAALEWSKVANLKFDAANHARAEIRISTVPDGRSWSYIGMDAATRPQTEATMNFGWLTPKSTDADVSSVVLHEFGHALGAIHEHQSPGGAIEWNEPVVLKACAAMAWSEAQCRFNILDRYTPEGLKFTRIDPTSIMMYAFPVEWTTNKVGTPWNVTLSPSDRQFIGMLYPRTTAQ